MSDLMIDSWVIDVQVGDLQVNGLHSAEVSVSPNHRKWFSLPLAGFRGQSTQISANQP